MFVFIFYSDVTYDWSFNRFQPLPVTILLTLISLYTLYNPLSSHGIQQWKLHGNVWHATPSLMHATHLCSLVRSGFQVNYGKAGMSSVIIAYWRTRKDSKRRREPWGHEIKYKGSVGKWLEKHTICTIIVGIDNSWCIPFLLAILLAQPC